MYLLLNGSFGIGKTTVATLLEREVPGAVIYDPENVGYVMRRLPPFLVGISARHTDYQEMWLWRTLIAPGARRAHRRASVVIIPMAFTNLAYLDGLEAALAPSSKVHRLCLCSPAETVTARLAQRAAAEGRAMTEFETRRSAECIAAHADPAFGFPIDATQSPVEIVAAIRNRTQI